MLVSPFTYYRDSTQALAETDDRKRRTARDHQRPAADRPDRRAGQPQAVSDIFLGWQRAPFPAAVLPAYYYLRQLRDWKYSARIERMNHVAMTTYGRMCGWTLARVHARTGTGSPSAAYLGRSDTFDQAVADFAEAHADQTERD